MLSIACYSENYYCSQGKKSDLQDRKIMENIEHSLIPQYFRILPQDGRRVRKLMTQAELDLQRENREVRKRVKWNSGAPLPKALLNLVA